jgi:hypothetical protein
MESYCTEVQYLHFLWGIQPVKDCYACTGAELKMKLGH